MKIAKLVMFLFFFCYCDCMDIPQSCIPIPESIIIHHLACDFMKCSITNDVAILEMIMREAARRSGATDLEFAVHKFKPNGISATLILAESHISLHYWYEQKYASIDIVTCGKCNPHKALEYLRHMFKPMAVVCKNIERITE